MKLIETKTLATATNEIQFTSIPQDGTDLLLLTSIRTDRNVANGGNFNPIGLNGSYANFTSRELRGTGSSVATYTDTVVYVVGAGSDDTGNTFGNSILYIPNYTGSTNKSLSIDGVGENNASAAVQSIRAGLWSQTAAITSLSVKGIETYNMIAGSTFSLYKITKGSDGIVTTS